MRKLLRHVLHDTWKVYAVCVEEYKAVAYHLLMWNISQSVMFCTCSLGCFISMCSLSLYLQSSLCDIFVICPNIHTILHDSTWISASRATPFD